MALIHKEVDIDEAIGHLRDLVPGYLSRREDLMALASAIASKREVKAPAEAQAARILDSQWNMLACSYRFLISA